MSYQELVSRLADQYRRQQYDTPLPSGTQSIYEAWRNGLPEDLRNTEDYDLQGAYMAGAKSDYRQHMTDQFKKPNHMTFSEGSQYSTADHKGGKWVEDGRGGWVFWASPTNLQYHPINEMGNYFKTVERGNTVVLPLDYKLPKR